jgi:hypothetical protein
MARPLDLSRRRFLQGALALGGAATAGATLQRIAQAAEAETDRYFIFCYFEGGWDVTLSLDPRDPDVFTEERRRETLIDTQYPGAKPATVGGAYVGPYLGRLLGRTGNSPRTNWLEAGRVSLVRGLSMDSLGHINARRRFLTGKVPRGDFAVGSSIATHLAYELGHNNPIANLAIRSESYNRDLPGWATAVRAGSPAELIRILSPGEAALSIEEEEQIDQVLGQFSECRTTCLSDVRSLALDAREEAGALTRRGIDRMFDFSVTNPLTAGVRSIFEPSPTTGSTSSSTLAAMATQAVLNKVARVVSVQLTGNLDTHGPLFAEHGDRQQAGFNAIADMLQVFADTPYDGTSDWIDHVTIVAYSEFARSALLGNQGGRDHHLMNACLLAGADVGGRRVVGASSDVGMMPQPVDFATGAVSAAGQIIRPEHVLRGLMCSAGISDDVADLRVDPLNAAFRSLSPAG